MPKRGEVRQFELRTLKKRPSMGSRPHCFFLKTSNISAKEKKRGWCFQREGYRYNLYNHTCLWLIHIFPPPFWKNSPFFSRTFVCFGLFVGWFKQQAPVIPLLSQSCRVEDWKSALGPGWLVLGKGWFENLTHPAKISHLNVSLLVIVIKAPRKIDPQISWSSDF